LKIHRNALIAVIVRDGQIIIPRGDDSIRLKDSIIVITSQPNIASLADIF
jgi:trk system potassium uptake protein TrkA